MYVFILVQKQVLEFSAADNHKYFIKYFNKYIRNMKNIVSEDKMIDMLNVVDIIYTQIYAKKHCGTYIKALL